jgi:hypothetical protein
MNLEVQDKITAPRDNRAQSLQINNKEESVAVSDKSSGDFKSSTYFL